MKKLFALLFCLMLLFTTAIAESEVDIDFSVMEGDAILEMLDTMSANSDDYLGMTVKMTGTFMPYQKHDENDQPIPGQVYYLCVMEDTDGCSAFALEFMLPYGKEYPTDYPEAGAVFTVIGTFDTYEQDGNLSMYLVDCELIETNPTNEVVI